MGNVGNSPCAFLSLTNGVCNEGCLADYQQDPTQTIPCPLTFPTASWSKSLLVPLAAHSPHNSCPATFPSPGFYPYSLWEQCWSPITLERLLLSWVSSPQLPWGSAWAVGWADPSLPDTTRFSQHAHAAGKDIFPVPVPSSVWGRGLLVPRANSG